MPQPSVHQGSGGITEFLESPPGIADELGGQGSCRIRPISVRGLSGDAWQLIVAGGTKGFIEMFYMKAPRLPVAAGPASMPMPMAASRCRKGPRALATKPDRGCSWSNIAYREWSALVSASRFVAHLFSTWHPSGRAVEASFPPAGVSAFSSSISSAGPFFWAGTEDRRRVFCKDMTAAFQAIDLPVWAGVELLLMVRGELRDRLPAEKSTLLLQTTGPPASMVFFPTVQIFNGPGDILGKKSCDGN